MDPYMNASGFPAGGSLRLSGTMLQTSAEFQAVVRQSGEQNTPSAGTTKRNRPERAWHSMRGLWE